MGCLGKCPKKNCENKQTEENNIKKTKKAESPHVVGGSRNERIEEKQSGTAMKD